MEIRCLGEVKSEPARYEELIIELKELANNEKQREKLSSILTYLHLGEKRYVPLTDNGEIDHSENRCRDALERSKETPQLVGEVVESRTASMDLSISPAMMNRLWLYDGKLYQSTRNDYNQEQVHLLILDFLDKEKRKFKELEEKFKKK